jgi:pimeloyl-ACP methyl ester carboxylesterase
MFVTSGRAQLAYEITGAEHGADVLLIHAGVTDRRSWRPLVEQLGPRHRCLTYDMRGYGETSYQREDGWSPVADALAVLQAADVKQAVVVASSMGGETGLDLTLAYPDRVAALVLIGTAIRGAPYPELVEGPTAELNAKIESAAAAGNLDEVNRLEAWLWLDGPAAHEGRVGGRVRELFLEMNGHALRAESPGKQAEIPPAWPRLSEIAVPTLIMVGRLDADDIVAINEPAANMIPNARLIWLDNVAHVPQLEGDPTTLNEIVRFIDSLR